MQIFWNLHRIETQNHNVEPFFLQDFAKVYYQQLQGVPKSLSAIAYKKKID